MEAGTGNDLSVQTPTYVSSPFVPGVVTSREGGS